MDFSKSYNKYYTITGKRFETYTDIAKHYDVCLTTVYSWVKKGVTSEGDIIRTRYNTCD